DLRGVRRVHRLAWLLERRGWRRFDRDSVRDVDLVVATTPETERELAAIAPAANVEVVTNGMQPRAQAGAGADVAFIGRMDLDVNADAVEWFVTDVWPHIR